LRAVAGGAPAVSLKAYVGIETGAETGARRTEADAGGCSMAVSGTITQRSVVPVVRAPLPIRP
jgi:hypothetical protein